ncbi:MAG: ATP-binding protein [Bacteroidetes bacterium HGW-Bacteroidetes-17]|jgi:nitrogen fixation/metabolism regulation signal transduction histidine kinase|nr:MAG: ATP-binding protein [Bacteroidetes bacterium HGW-Bacteroidetes-17]
MVSKKFIFGVVIRIFGILISIVLLSVCYFILDRNQLIFTFTVGLSVFGFLISNLIIYVTRTNRELAKFLMSIKHSDFSVYYSTEHKKSYVGDLHQAFNEIIVSFKEIKIEKELQLQFLTLIVEQINVGLIALNGNKELILMNSAAENILGVKKTKTWNQLATKIVVFTSEVDKLTTGGKKLIELEESKKQLSLNVSSSLLLEENHIIISFQDIKGEIEQKEAEAWIRLIRILNHEIMNSVTPISSLTETILMILGKDENKVNIEDLSTEQIRDVIRSVKTIQNRSDGLFDFVTEYRKLTKIPQPKIETVAVNDLLQNAEQLWKPELIKNHIAFEFTKAEDSLTINADPNLIEQVLINLIKNSIQALESIENPKLSITAFNDNGKICIQVKDNGVGIPSNLINDIFVPFFTTKEKGSGIGLSLSRQIMRMHGGNISVQSIPQVETIFTLSF